MIEENIREYLLTQTGITNLVSTRIYPNYLPQKPTFPAITYTRIGGPRTLKLNPGRSKLAAARIQMDIWASTYSGVKILAEQVRLSLQGFQGELSDNVDAQAIHFYGDFDLYEPETKEYRVVMDFEIWHAES